jgi:hypothetical protein
MQQAAKISNKATEGVQDIGIALRPDMSTTLRDRLNQVPKNHGILHVRRFQYAIGGKRR